MPIKSPQELELQASHSIGFRLQHFPVVATTAGFGNLPLVSLRILHFMGCGHARGQLGQEIRSSASGGCLSMSPPLGLKSGHPAFRT
eukprot:CAMPEP_0183549812 /NCGR_PEP_ID=MMETSP0371-20130417/63791_1 /TAXON_ID=268820 /ORGANISM="Peridinium aciculiferum, Strain PAER-2" /LENGTH=86 /DNA_ID=CAMNT_0025753713 /DNA_START=336 /DNA_END=592 /DNA_ORIENTATION=+